MGRPPKKGLVYFPKDVGFYDDFKIMDLLALHGPTGVTIYEVILTEVYKNGYYLAEPIDRVATKVVRIIGSKWVQKRLVSQVILDCGELGLFETTLLQHGVITSVGIQRRYASVTSRSKANKDRYWLIDKNDEPLFPIPFIPVPSAKTGVSAAKTPVNEGDIPQNKSKQNKSKLNKRREEREEKDLLEESYQDVVFRLLLVDGDTYPITTKDMENYQKLYPSTEVEQEFRKMVGWIFCNPQKRKTLEGIEKFIHGWLGRAQIPTGQKMEKKNRPNRFHNFEQREEDYDAMILEQVRRNLIRKSEGNDAAGGTDESDGG